MSSTCFDLSVDKVVEFMRDRIAAEAHVKQLYLHNLGHAAGVLRRAELIFSTVRPFWHLPEPEIERWHRLLKIGAISHNVVQLFWPSFQIYAPRRRQISMSKIATTQLLFDFIDQLNQQISLSSARFTGADKAVLHQVIQATICTYNERDKAIFQPELYENPDLSPVARIIALADLGTLGIDGINAFNQAASLKFLEENPDTISVLRVKHPQEVTTSEHLTSIRERLLKLARFQVQLAHSRLNRTLDECSGLPSEALPELETHVFKYLIADTVDIIEHTTPTDNDTDINTLLAFFNFPFGTDSVIYEVFPGLVE
jgi:hypothetical protein